MKKAVVYIVSIALLLAAFAVATDKTASEAVRQPVKVRPVRAARMYVTGKVVAVNKKSIKIDRKVKKEKETMLFVLPEAVAGIAVDDVVKITYSEKEGCLVSDKVARIGPKKKEIIVVSEQLDPFI